jgi:hypothetical protein
MQNKVYAVILPLSIYYLNHSVVLTLSCGSFWMSLGIFLLVHWNRRRDRWNCNHAWLCFFPVPSCSIASPRRRVAWLQWCLRFASSLVLFKEGSGTLLATAPPSNLLRLPVGPIGRHGHYALLYSLISVQGYAGVGAAGWPAADGAGLKLLEVMRNHRQEGAIRSLTLLHKSWEFPGSVLWVRNNYFQIQNLFQLFSDPDPGQKLAKGF